MSEIRFDYTKAKDFVSTDEMNALAPYIKVAHDTVQNKSGLGNDFLGWVDLPVNYDKDEFARIKKAAEKIRNDSDALIVIGIGGSYLGARAAIEMISHSFYNSVSKEMRKGPQIFYAGNRISSRYLSDLIDAVD